MIEEKMTIDFEEYLSYFDDTGKLKDGVNTKCFYTAFNKVKEAVDKFLSGVTIVAHHGLKLHSTKFYVLDVTFSDDDLVSLDIRDGLGVVVVFSFDATMKLEMTRTNDCVVLDSRMV